MDLSRELTDEEVRELIMQEVLRFSSRNYLLLEEKLRIQKELFNGIRRLDLLQELIEDPLVTEIMVNGPEDIFVEKGGRLFRWDKQFTSAQKLEDVVQQIVSFCNRNISKANPIADARLADGSRVNIVLDPVALNGPVITIRRFPEHPIRIAQLIEWGSVTREAAEFLREAVTAGYNIFVSGGTGSGKTTFLNALSEFIPPGERIITIEDNAELQLVNSGKSGTLGGRNATGGGAMRLPFGIHTNRPCMRPTDFVGEVRGGRPLDMLQAMNTGHDGSLQFTGMPQSQGHAEPPGVRMVLMGMDLPWAGIRGR